MPRIYSFDHQFSSAMPQHPLAILYGELGTPQFAELHSALLEMAMSDKVHYLFRHYVKVRDTSTHNDMGGEYNSFSEITSQTDVAKWLWSRVVCEEYRVQGCR